MLNPSISSISFERHRRGTFTKAARYRVIVSILTITLSAISGAAVFIAVHLRKVDSGWVCMSAVVMVAIMGTILAIFVARHSNDRTDARVTLRNNGIEFIEQGVAQCWHFDDVVGLQIIPTWTSEACQLILRDGTCIRLPPDITPFARIRERLTLTLGARLARKMADRIELIDAVEVRDNGLRAWLCIVYGMLLFLCAAPLCVSISFAKPGAVLMATGCRRLRQGWRGTGHGFLADHEGVREISCPGTLLAEWSLLQQAEIDDFGLILRFRNGVILRVSLFAVDYWVFAEFVRRYRPVRASFASEE